MTTFEVEPRLGSDRRHLSQMEMRVKGVLDRTEHHLVGELHRHAEKVGAVPVGQPQIRWTCSVEQTAYVMPPGTGLTKEEFERMVQQAAVAGPGRLPMTLRFDVRVDEEDAAPA